MCTANIRIIDRSEDLPEMKSYNFFHSPELFRIIEQTPGNYPYMVIATDDKGEVIAHMFATLRRRGSWLPPYLYTQSRVYGEGEYEDLNHKEELFGMMLKALTHKIDRSLCLFIEFSDISEKMFGYQHFRSNGFFPLLWQEIHNSLHSKRPEERLSRHTQNIIKKSYKSGVITREAETKEEIRNFYRLLRGFYRMKLRRLIPPYQQFLKLSKTGKAKILLTIYKNKIIGGCACIYSENNAYLWYLASKAKSHPTLHPKTLTVWYAIQYAYEHQYAHISFMDVGLPWKKNPFRSFILSFGGKPVAKYRWFHFSIPFINRILSWFYSE
jgi:hypothetical protein